MLASKLKARIWDSFNQKFYPLKETQIRFDESGDVSMVTNIREQYRIKRPAVGVHQQMDYILQFSFGDKDLKGNLIFESDVCMWVVDKQIAIGVVSYDQSGLVVDWSFTWVDSNPDFRSNLSELMSKYSDTFEVVGNKDQQANCVIKTLQAVKMNAELSDQASKLEKK